VKASGTRGGGDAGQEPFEVSAQRYITIVP
jgi:hypothetical protein